MKLKKLSQKNAEHELKKNAQAMFPLWVVMNRERLIEWKNWMRDKIREFLNQNEDE